MFASEVNNDGKTGHIYGAHCSHKLTVKTLSTLMQRGLDKLQRNEHSRKRKKQQNSASRRSVTLCWLYFRNGVLSCLQTAHFGNPREPEREDIVPPPPINEGPHYTILGNGPFFSKEISLGYSRKYCQTNFLVSLQLSIFKDISRVIR